MNGSLARTILRSIAATTIAMAVIFGGLAAYCAWNVGSFYDGAQRLNGTIVEVNRLAGGNAPVVQFVDQSGLVQVKQFGPFYEAAPETVGEIRTVLFNPDHELQSVIDTPWNWIGAIFYTLVMAALFAANRGLLYLDARLLSPRLAQPNGA